MAYMGKLHICGGHGPDEELRDVSASKKNGLFPAKIATSIVADSHYDVLIERNDQKRFDVQRACLFQWVFDAEYY